MSDQNSETSTGTEGESIQKSPGSEAPEGAPDESGASTETPGGNPDPGVVVNTEGGDATVENG